MIEVTVPAELEAFVDSSLARLGYLYPDVGVTYEAKTSRILIETSSAAVEEQQIRKEALYQLYREKIRHDTMPIRRQLYGAP